MVKRFHATIFGKVQGVFFRATTYEQAKALGLKGFVKNLPDGSVELDAEGEEDQLLELLHWCQHGPPGARVDKMSIEWQIPKNLNTEFYITS